MVRFPYFCIKISNYIITMGQKNGLKIDEFSTHQIPPNLKFCLSSSKEKKDLFVLKQLNLIFKDIFLFYTTIFFDSTNRLEISQLLYDLKFQFSTLMKEKFFSISITNKLMNSIL